MDRQLISQVTNFRPSNSPRVAGVELVKWLKFRQGLSNYFTFPSYEAVEIVGKFMFQ